MNRSIGLLLSSIIVFSTIVTGCYRVSRYTGDGQLIDNGMNAATNRYVLNLGQIDLTQQGVQIFRIVGLPNINFGAGLEMIAFDNGSIVEWGTVNPTLAIKLTDPDGRCVFMREAPLNIWTWSVRVGESRAFVYGRDSSKTFFDANSNVEYTLTLQVIEPDHSQLRYTALLMLKSGGWK